jgi:hypothetical protein
MNVHAKVITAGIISEEAQAWLLAHECTIEESLGLSIILLSIEAQVEPGQYNQEYTIAFYDSEGNYEPTCAVVHLEIDAYDTRVTLHKEGGATSRGVNHQ